MNSRALRIYEQSQHIGHDLVEALLLLESVEKHLPRMFDTLVGQNIHAARKKAEEKTAAKRVEFIEEDAELDLDF